MLAFLAGEDWVFASHFLPMGRAARDAGFRVLVIATRSAAAEDLAAQGFPVIDPGLARAAYNPTAVAAGLVRLVRILRRARVDRLHASGLRACAFGAMAARLAGIHGPILAITGFGFTAVGQGAKTRFARAVLRLALPPLIWRRRAWVLVENPDDGALAQGLGLASPDRTLLLPGAGVDPDLFRPAEPGRPSAAPGAPVTILVVARMLWSKGIDLAVAAFQALDGRLRAQGGAQARLVLAGGIDAANPGAIPAETLAGWARIPGITWLGHRTDIADLWRSADIALLPSRGGEGLPRALIEAQATGLPAVTTDVPGCRHLVLDGRTGLVVPPGDAGPLAGALERLVRDRDLRQRLGAAGRARVVADFSESRIAERVGGLYHRLIPR